MDLETPDRGQIPWALLQEDVLGGGRMLLVADTLRLLVFTASVLGTLFLGRKKIITVSVSPPSPTQQRSLPVQLVCSAILVEAEEADTRLFSPLRKGKHAWWHCSVCRDFLMESDSSP